MKFLLYFHTLRYLKARQILARITFLIKRKALGGFIIARVSKITLIEHPTFLKLQPKCFSNYGRQNLSQRQFHFLNLAETYSPKIWWNDHQKPKLWLYNLHYFEYLLPMAARPSEAHYVLGKAIIQDWIKNNPIGQGNGWEPYPISLRLVHWIFFYQSHFSFFQQDKTFENSFLTSLLQQVTYLRFFLEEHLLANHFWANAKALFFAGIFFNRPQWIEHGLKLVRQELNEQVLPDGGHYERSPMYHALFLTDVIDLINLLQAKERASQPLTKQVLSLKQELISKAELMWHWLKGVTQPDGQPALFGDTAIGAAPSTDEIGNYLQSVLNRPVNFNNRQSVAFNNSGYFIYRDAQRFLMIDGGSLGVNYQPGHAHCDFLSYELSLKGRRFIVDSGLGEYLPTKLRQRARSIQSHNTLVINGLDQAELWAAFRMGKRIRPDNVLCQLEPIFEFQGSYFNPLKKKLRYRHQRTVRVEKSIQITDAFSGPNLKSVENLIHVHPACTIQREEGRLRIARDDIQLIVEFNPKLIGVELREWFYVPKFGNVLTAPLIVLIPLAGQTSMQYVLRTGE